MSLSLVEIKEKLKPQLKELWGVDDFKIVTAEHKDQWWMVFVEYNAQETSPSGALKYYKIKKTGLGVNDETGQIEAML